MSANPSVDVVELRALLAPGEEHEWRPHDGGGRPNAPRDFVQARLRSGLVIATGSAFIPWPWGSGDGPEEDVMEWRPAKEPPSRMLLASYVPSLLDRIESSEARERGMRAVIKPRLNTAIIEAAAEGHFGKQGLRWDSIDGLDITNDGINWSFRRAFTRMWHSAWAEIERQAALSPDQGVAKEGGGA